MYTGNDDKDINNSQKGTLDEEAAKVKWQYLVQDAKVLSPNERSVIDAALSIADEVLGKTTSPKPSVVHEMSPKEVVTKQPEKKLLEEAAVTRSIPKEPRPATVAQPNTPIKEPTPVATPVIPEDTKMQDVFSGAQMEDDLGLEPVRMVIDDLPDEIKASKKKKRKKIIAGIFAFLVLLLVGAGVLFDTLLNRLQYDIPLEVLGGRTVTANGEVDVNLVLRNEGIRTEDTMVPVDYDGENILNFLLIGEEAIAEADGVNGRSDSMMVLTLNMEDNSIKITSFMRDLYVNIPGYGQNRLNAAFMFGGSELVEQTLNSNFGVYVDGYVKVNFEGFKKIVNKIGGVEITLTQEEADYLNSTNYIKEKKNRTVVAGKQTLNGSQALGYSRVRYVKGVSESDDFGRTARQRTVIMAAYEKVKQLNAFDILTAVYEVLPYITTNIPKEDIIMYAKMAISLDFDSIESFRIPVDGSFQFANVRLGNVVANVIIADIQKNRNAIFEFLFNGQVPENLPAIPQVTVETTTETPSPEEKIHVELPETESKDNENKSENDEEEESEEEPVVTKAPEEEPEVTKAPVVEETAPPVEVPEVTEEPVVPEETPVPEEDTGETTITED